MPTYYLTRPDDLRKTAKSTGTTLSNINHFLLYTTIPHLVNSYNYINILNWSIARYWYAVYAVVKPRRSTCPHDIWWWWWYMGRRITCMKHFESFIFHMHLWMLGFLGQLNSSAWPNCSSANAVNNFSKNIHTKKIAIPLLTDTVVTNDVGCEDNCCECSMWIILFPM